MMIYPARASRVSFFNSSLFEPLYTQRRRFTGDLAAMRAHLSARRDICSIKVEGSSIPEDDGALKKSDQGVCVYIYSVGGGPAANVSISIPVHTRVHLGR